MFENNDPLTDITSGEVKVIPPDYTLKKTIGEDFDLKQIFTEENIEKAQNTIDKHKDDFVEWAIKDVALLDEYYNKALINIELSDPEIACIEHVASILKSRAGTFNFGLATLVAKSLGDFCMRHPQSNPDHLIVIRKHIDTLAVIFTKKIIGDGGIIGNELLENLSKLVERYN